jgi:hypothetical protein
LGNELVAREFLLLALQAPTTCSVTRLPTHSLAHSLIVVTFTFIQDSVRPVTLLFIIIASGACVSLTTYIHSFFCVATLLTLVTILRQRRQPNACALRSLLLRIQTGLHRSAEELKSASHDSGSLACCDYIS